MNIVCLFLSFNGIGNARGMYGDLVCELANRGHHVYVLAASKNGETGIEVQGNIKICWVRSLKLLNVGFITKTFANLLLPYQFTIESRKFLPKKVDMIISPTPPITLSKVILKIKRKHKALFYLILRDIFPQNAVDLGIISRGSMIYRYFRKVEKFLYSISDWIGCMSQGNVDYLLSNNPELNISKVHILPNWVDINKDIELGNSNFIKEYKLENKYIALFGGNLGVAQNPMNIIDLACLHSDKKDVVFLIIGKGIQKNKLKDSIKEKGLNNVIMVEHLPRDEYEALASMCHVGLVSLNGNFTIPNIPSRTLGYWQAKLPVLAIVDRNTDLGESLIDKCRGGVWCIENDMDQYKRLFDSLYYNKELSKQMGLNGYNALCNEYNVSKAVDILLNI